MRIDGLNLDLRERNAWEAFDLGVALARSTGLRLFLPYGTVFVGLALLIQLAAWGQPLLALAIMIWVKPISERVALAVLAQAVFGAAPASRASLAGLPRIPRTGLFMTLTLGRFDLARSFHLPVRQLEGQKGKAWRERVRLLDKKLRGHAVWLTLAMFSFIIVLIYGINGLLGLLLPEDVHAGLDWSVFFEHGEQSLVNQYLLNAYFIVAECLLEPVYVAAGLALYLSRRTALEGWDLEVAFKRMAARIEEQTRRAMLPAAGTRSPACWPSPLALALGPRRRNLPDTAARTSRPTGAHAAPEQTAGRSAAPRPRRKKAVDPPGAGSARIQRIRRRKGVALPRPQEHCQGPGLRPGLVQLFALFRRIPARRLLGRRGAGAGLALDPAGAPFRLVQGLVQDAPHSARCAVRHGPAPRKPAR